MSIIIREVISEIVLGGSADDATDGAGRGGGQAIDDARVDEIVRRATERVLAVLREEWDR